MFCYIENGIVVTKRKLTILCSRCSWWHRHRCHISKCWTGTCATINRSPIGRLNCVRNIWLHNATIDRCLPRTTLTASRQRSRISIYRWVTARRPLIMIEVIDGRLWKGCTECWTRWFVYRSRTSTEIRWSCLIGMVGEGERERRIKKWAQTKTRMCQSATWTISMGNFRLFWILAVQIRMWVQAYKQ